MRRELLTVLKFPFRARTPLSTAAGTEDHVRRQEKRTVIISSFMRSMLSGVEAARHQAGITTLDGRSHLGRSSAHGHLQA